ncbi:MAG: hypothetical protein ACI4D8_07975 [Wujia sp.]
MVVIILCMVLNGINNIGLLNYFRDDVEVGKQDVNVELEIMKLFQELGDIEYSPEIIDEMYKEYLTLYDGSDPSVRDEKGKYSSKQKYDSFVYGTAKEYMSFLGTYCDELPDIIMNAEQMRENNKYLGKYSDSYKDKELAKMIGAYTRLQNDVELRLCYTLSAFVFGYTETEGVNKFNSQLLLLFISCIFAVYFASEYETKMNQMVFATYRGRLNTFICKNTVIFFSSFVITFLSCLINATIIIVRYGSMKDALSQPIQLIYDKEQFAMLCPFSMTFGQYILLEFFMKFTALYFAANIVTLIALIFRRSVAAISISAFLLIGLLQLTIYASQLNLDYYEVKSDKLYRLFIWLKTFSPISLLWGREYVNSFDAINVFGIPVYRLAFALVFAWILIVVLFVINSCLYCRRSVGYGIGIVEYLKKIWKKRDIA